MIKHLFLLLVTLFFCCQASADTTVYTCSSGVYRTDAASACQAILPAPWTFASMSGMTCFAKSSPTNAAQAYAGCNPMTCTGSTPVFDQAANGGRGMCVPAPPPPPPPTCPSEEAGDMTVTTSYATGPQVGAALASVVVPDGGHYKMVWCAPNKCLVSPSGPPKSCSQSQSPGANGFYKISCIVPMKQNGPCPATSPPPAPDGAPEPPGPGTGGTGKCPAGSTPTGVDSSGMTICTGTSQPPTPPTSNTQKPPTTNTDAQGNTVTTSQSTSTNADGSTTTTTTTTTGMADGSTKTDVTVTTGVKPDGSPGDEDTPEDKNDLCKRNPQLTICRNSQVMGSCEAVTCDGDAIQCATLRAAATMECRDKADRDELGASPQVALAKQMMAGQDPMALPTKANGSTVTLPGSLDSSGWLGGGAFFSDKSFQVQGKSITIPFSQVGPYLVVFRYAMMIIALLVAFRILSGAVIRE